MEMVRSDDVDRSCMHCIRENAVVLASCYVVAKVLEENAQDGGLHAIVVDLGEDMQS